MNKQLLKTYLTRFSQWYQVNHMQADTEWQEREKLAADVRRFTEAKLQTLTEEELFDYLAPLWAMAMWGNKHYQIDNIIEANGMPLLRAQFSNLIYGSAPLAARWDEFRSKVKGVGPAVMSELLCKTFPDRYLIWNRKAYVGFKLLEVSDIPRYEARLNGKRYEYLAEQGREMVEFAKQQGFSPVKDMLTLNSFIWQELKPEDAVMTDVAKEADTDELLPKNKKEAQFVHNDIRDKVADIGRSLGFHADVECKVADGAIVDAVWEVTIGNMGRVIYVFEVQTSGSIDSLILNLMKAKNNKAVQGIVAVTDQKQIEKVKREISALPIKDEVKFWDYTEVLRVYESLQFVNESINNLELVAKGF